MPRPIRLAALAAAAVILVWTLLLTLWFKSSRQIQPSQSVKAEALAPAVSIDSLAESIRNEAGALDRLTVTQVEGIVIIRGRAKEQRTIERASQIAKDRGFSRVANLIQVSATTDDESIERQAERELAQARGLDGCRFNVDSTNGILTVSGVVQHELQKDLARELLRRVPGIREVRTDLKRL